MPRTTKGAARNKAKRRLYKRAKGYRGGRGNLLRTVKETLLRSGQYAYRRGRRRTWRPRARTPRSPTRWRVSPAAKSADWRAVFRVVSIGIQSGGKGVHFPTRGAATATPSVRGKRTSSRDASDANEAKGSTRRRRRAKRHTHGRTRAAPGTKKRSNPAGSLRETQRPWRLKCNAS